MKLLLSVLVLAAAAMHGASAESTEVGTAAELGVDMVDLPNGETFKFESETQRMLQILVHSLYSKRDVFLRELISNANDALAKLRHAALTDSSVLEADSNLEIRVSFDKENNTVTIRDTGCGMTKEELVKNLGTLAYSATAKFAEELENAENAEAAASQIGQFGVGFYSAFLVADSVVVNSVSYKDDTQHTWVSNADGTFKVAETENTLGRGTEIVLKLKERDQEFLDADLLEKTVKHYSEFVEFPVQLQVEEQVEVEVPEETEGEDEEAEEKTKTVTETQLKWRRVNSQAPVWRRQPDEISDEDYAQFFRSISGGTSAGEPAMRTHFKTEGQTAITGLLFVPDKAPMGMYDNYYSKKSSVRLYVRRVLLNDEFEDLLPRYLSFVRGVVDADDLPINVNRETLQESKVMRVISRKLTRKALDMLKRLAQEEIDELSPPEQEEGEEESEASDEEEEKEVKTPQKRYTKFFKEFGKSVKLGVMEDQANRKRLLPLLRFQTTTSDGELVSLDSYVERMKENQKDIYFIADQSIEQLEGSPFLDRFRALGLEVLYATDPLDEYVFQQVTEYDGHRIVSITKEGLKLPSVAEDLKPRLEKFQSNKQEELKPLCDWMKELFSGQVDKVEVGFDLVDAPAAVVTAQWGWSANMARIAQAQAFGGEAQQWMMPRKTLQLNWRHPVVTQLAEIYSENNKEAESMANLLLDAALVSSGFTHEAPAKFASRIYEVLQLGLKLPLDAGLLAEPDLASMPELDEPEEEEEDENDEEDHMEL
ncbi:MAG: hypothetical protein MHM6MM_003160 [Cercozoa sp. M6MM]